MRMTMQIAHSIAWDAGNRSMKKAGRSTWNHLDWNAATAEFNRLWKEGFYE